MADTLILALDTCTSACSIALGDGARVLGEHTWRTDRHHTADVTRRIRQLYIDSGVRPADTAAIAVALGPGSFTGVRCGIAIAKGMAAAGNAKLIGVGAFDILRVAQPGSPSSGQPLVAVIEAGRKRVAVKQFGPANASDFTLQTFDEFAAQLPSPCYVCGDIPAQFEPKDLLQLRAPPWLNVRRASVLLGMAAERLDLGSADDPVSLVPVYPP